MELYLHHGRKTVDESLDDWGPNGPTLKGVKGIHQTYGNGPNVFFKSRNYMILAKALTGWEEWDDNALTMRWAPNNEGLVEVRDGSNTIFYGDWGII